MKEEEKKVWNYAVRLLARRNYHSITLRKKLKEKGSGTPEEIESIIKKLKECRYLNDEEYIRYYVSDQLLLRPQSIRLVRQKLRQRGIQGEAVEQELARHAHREEEFARKAVRKKLKTVRGESQQKQREKLFRFLTARGFPLSTIKEVLK